jgi:SAM-dependent methyltransferase
MRRLPDRRLAREHYDRLAATYDRRLRLLRGAQEAVRRSAIERLRLRPGDVVLDIGCGTGASFALLEDAIGADERVIGVELSPGMLSLARRRVECAGWRNVTLVQAAAEEAVVPGLADAALLFFTHDVMRSRAALDNMLRAVRPGGRVVAAGGRLASWWLLPVNVAGLLLVRRYVTTFAGASRPWSPLAGCVADLEVESFDLGLVYIAAGSARGGGAYGGSAAGETGATRSVVTHPPPVCLDSLRGVPAYRDRSYRQQRWLAYRPGAG